MTMGLMNSAAIPILTARVVRSIGGGRGLASGMNMSARFVSTILLPLVLVVVYNDGCMQRWRSLWEPCLAGDHEFDQTFNTPFLWFDHAGPMEVEVVRDELSSSLLTESYVCGGTSLGTLDAGLCARSALWVLIPLYISKALFAMCIQPMLVFVIAGSPRSRSWLLPLVVEKVTKSVERPHTTLIALNEEYLSVVTWCEIAIIFGPFSPLLTTLTALSIYTNVRRRAWSRGKWSSIVICPPLSHQAIAYSHALKRLNANYQIFPAGNIPLASYLILSIGLSTCAVSIFFACYELHGWQLVVIVSCSASFALLCKSVDELFTHCASDELSPELRDSESSTSTADPHESAALTGEPEDPPPDAPTLKRGESSEDVVAQPEVLRDAPARSFTRAAIIGRRDESSRRG